MPGRAIPFKCGGKAGEDRPTPFVVSLSNHVGASFPSFDKFRTNGDG
jgi:hypothetical protein